MRASVRRCCSSSASSAGQFNRFTQHCEAPAPESKGENRPSGRDLEGECGLVFQEGAVLVLSKKSVSGPHGA